MRSCVRTIPFKRLLSSRKPNAPAYKYLYETKSRKYGKFVAVTSKVSDSWRPLNSSRSLNALNANLKKSSSEYVRTIGSLSFCYARGGMIIPETVIPGHRTTSSSTSHEFSISRRNNDRNVVTFTVRRSMVIIVAALATIFRDPSDR